MLEELVLEEEEEIDDRNQSVLDNNQWEEFSEKQKSFPFIGVHGLLKDLQDNIRPAEAFSVFIDEEITNILVTETNKYAQQKMEQNRSLPCRRINKWKLTDCEEIKKFLGLIIWMGLVKPPSIDKY